MVTSGTSGCGERAKSCDRYRVPQVEARPKGPVLAKPVIHLRGTLDPDGVAQLAPQILDQGMSDETVAVLRSMINPAMLPLLEFAPGGLRGALIANLGPEIGRALAGGPEIEVYQQTPGRLGLAAPWEVWLDPRGTTR